MSKAEVKPRKQFTFRTSAQTLSCILTLNVAADSPVLVNVVAFSVTPVVAKKGATTSNKIDTQPMLLVKMVVGTDDPDTTERGGGPATNKEQNTRFRQILQSQRVRFSVATVIQLFNLEAVTGSPGAYRVFYVALICAGVVVRASYQGEPARLLHPPPLPQCQTGVVTVMFQVPESQVAKALKILRSLNLLQPETQLCVNRFNVDNKCPCKLSDD